MTLPLRGKPFLVRLLVLGSVAFFFGRGVGVVSAETVHQVRLHQGARVIVWEPAQPRREGTVVQLAAAAPSVSHLIGSGHLVAARANAGPSAVAQRFRVATNTPFTIRVRNRADLSAMATPVTLAVTDVGSNAASPAGWTGIQTLVGVFDAKSGSTLFRMPERTARRRGTPLSQSIEFAIIWPSETASGAEVVIEAAR